MGSYSLDVGSDDLSSIDTIDMSTVDTNPTVDQSVSGTDGGASSFSDIANAVGRWGVTIGSIITNTPITAAQTQTGQVVPIGARGSTVAGSGTGFLSQPGSTAKIVIIVVIGLVIYAAVKK